MSVDKNIPAPTEPRGSGRYPFPQMAIGDSIFRAGSDRMKLLSAANSYRSRHPDWYYVSRKENDGVRVWRVEKPSSVDDVCIDRTTPAPSNDTVQDVWMDKIWQFIMHERTVSKGAITRRFQYIPATARESIVDTLLQEGKVQRIKPLAITQGRPATYYTPTA